MRVLLFLFLSLLAAAAGAALSFTTAAAAASSPPPSREAELLAAARALSPWLADLRKSLHETPELGFDLPLTHKKVSNVLKKLGVQHRRGRGKASDGIVATIGGDARSTESKSTKIENERTLFLSRPRLRPPRRHGRPAHPRGVSLPFPLQA